MADDESKPINIFEALKPDEHVFPVDRLRLGLILETMIALGTVQRRLNKNQEDAVANAMSELLNSQLLTAVAVLFVSIPKEDRDSLAKSAMTTINNDRKSLPKPPKLEDIV